MQESEIDPLNLLKASINVIFAILARIDKSTDKVTLGQQLGFVKHLLRKLVLPVLSNCPETNAFVLTELFKDYTMDPMIHLRYTVLDRLHFQNIDGAQAQAFRLKLLEKTLAKLRRYSNLEPDSDLSKPELFKHFISLFQTLPKLTEYLLEIEDFDVIGSLDSEALLSDVRDVDDKGMEQLTLILERCAVSAEEIEAI